MNEREDIHDSSGVDQIKTEVREILGEEVDVKEAEIGERIVDLIYETRFEKFQVTDITSVKNQTVEGKARLLFSRDELKDKVIPEFLTSQYPIQFDEETLKKAPWVNMIHAWNKVLNELNTVNAIQSEQIPLNPYVIASIAHVLYNFTTDSDGDRFIRSNEQFLSGKKFVETIKRESGTEGANPLRHICFEEMKYILDVIREQYSWGE